MKNRERGRKKNGKKSEKVVEATGGGDNRGER